MNCAQVKLVGKGQKSMGVLRSQPQIYFCITAVGDHYVDHSLRCDSCGTHPLAAKRST